VSLRIQASREAERITAFIGRTVGEAQAGGVVLGLSGGIDSAVVGALCVNALGKDRVLVLLMPSGHTPRRDLDDARKLADIWRVRWEEIPISGIVDDVIGSAKAEGNRMAKANVQARVRMVLLYYRANTLGYLVAGTGDRSEGLLGYYTKWGDGGVDFLPIAHLYKTQVRELGSFLGLPKRLVEKPASPQLWPGQKATDEIPANYDRLDVVLYCLYDLRVKPAEAAARARVPLEVVNRVLEMHARTEHKRNLPPHLA
jgi:NAD+ synthase